MMKHYLGMFLLVCTGAVAGVLLTAQRDIDPDETAAVATSVRPTLENDARVRALEQALAELNERLTELEQSRLESTIAAIQPIDEQLEENTGIRNTPLFQTSSEPVSFTDALIAAGLDAYNAEEIARKQSAVELRRLELRDQAIRDGTIGTDQYRQDLATLRQEEVNVRNEVDATVYDRYLYHTGQTNRVSVRSVMMGSTAENAGLQSGDVLLSYDDSTIYNFRDLRAATLGGERDETVNLRVDRGGTEMTVSVERGPLGVRLDPLRIDPDED